MIPAIEGRGFNFVTRKITIGLSKIKLGQNDPKFENVLRLGNLDAKRDWGYAKEYVEVMWLMLQQDNPEDFVIATGENHTIREFVEACCKELDIDIEWRGEGINEVGVDKETNKTIIEVDSKYFRPAEVEVLLGDPSKAKEKLNWEAKTKFEDLVKLMIRSDYKLIKSGGEVLY
jgi:GDPmannose 4,6-dehydratase